jgi:uncharacterized lipoprotein YmbA
MLAACASAPTRFLTLVPPPGSVPDGTAPTAGPKVSVSIPSQVDQPELVVRQPDGSMALIESERWIAPLGDEIRSSLVLSLAPRWNPAAPAQLRVDVQRFDSVPGREAYLEAVWTLTLDGTPDRPVSCRSAFREPIGPGYARLAAGHRAALGRLADEIFAASQALQAGRPATCRAP